MKKQRAADASFHHLPSTVSANEATGIMPAAVPPEEENNLTAMAGLHDPLFAPANAPSLTPDPASVPPMDGSAHPSDAHSLPRKSPSSRPAR